MKSLQKQYDEWKQRSKVLKSASAKSLISETPEQQQDRIKRMLSPLHYRDFFDYYFGGEVGIASSPSADFHIRLAQELYYNDTIQQFRLLFRGAAKSVHSNIGNPLFLFMNQKVRFFLLIGNNENRAKLLLADLQMQLESNQRIINDFGEQRVNGSWTDGEFLTKDGVYCMALGINQPFRGLRYIANRVDYAVVDDCEDRKRAQNQRLTIEYADKITSDLMGAFDKDRRRLVIANNYFVRNGLIDKLTDRLQDKPGTRIHRINITDQNGKPTWPERYSMHDIQRIKDSTDPLAYSREYLNTPVDEGKLFKPEWLKPITKRSDRLAGPTAQKNGGSFSPSGDGGSFSPSGDGGSFSPSGDGGSFSPSGDGGYIGYVIHWDLSYKTDGDYKAAALIAHTGRDIHLLKVFCRQCSVPEAMTWHYQTLNKLRLHIVSFYDATAAQREIYEKQWLETAVQFGSPYIPMPNIAPGIDKHIRIEATLVTAFFNRRLKITEQATQDPDWTQAKAQLLAFEKGTKAHDDFPDTLEAAVTIADKMFLQPAAFQNFNFAYGRDQNPNDKFY